MHDHEQIALSFRHAERPALVYWACLLEEVGESWAGVPYRDLTTTEAAAFARDAPEWFVEEVVRKYPFQGDAPWHGAGNCGPAYNEIGLLEGLEEHLRQWGADHLNWVGIWFPDGRLMHHGRAVSAAVLDMRAKYGPQHKPGA